MTDWSYPAVLSQLPRLRPRIAATLLAAVMIAGCSSTGTSTPSGPVPTGHYRVQTGDTLSKIARQSKQSVNNLVRWNGLSNPNQIHVGQVLRVTAPSGGASAPAATTTRTPAPSANTSRNTSASTAPTKKIALIWPADGNVIRQFGQNRANGITIANSAGTPVKAAAAGTVAYANSGLRGYGNMLIIRHSNGFLSVYAHNRKLLVQEGASVRQGQTIAEMGQSETTQPSLYFEVRQDGRVVDPRSLLPQR